MHAGFKRLVTLTGFGLSMLAGQVYAAQVLMSAEWAAQTCEAWNKDASLTTGLAGKWIKNDHDQGYKVIQMYRTDCESSPPVEIRIADKDGKAKCIYGGKLETAKPDSSVDYLMHATTRRWVEMGAGDYGPMKAMLFGRLKFSGPRMEAMGVLGPLGSFLKLIGKVPSVTSDCPE
ncbi:MAG: SCP2 sterol-binding domain-containing protein [Pseudomonadota bacterium]